MKKYMILAMLMCGALYTMQAQEVKPVYTQDGDMVKATFYHDNGQVAQAGQFLNGKLQGEWVMYDTSGKKIAIGQYANGVKTGKWFFWEGELLKEVDYSDNQIVAVVNWNNGESIVIN
ncbi:MAG: nicotinic acid mononucleotide adenyltransferase [Robiginitalea sp.]|uniref:toxin-antitoxin system YwqK family antitoxin n=1 Tax=Robiginitalea sp. TaxID=1902411 RepID=UPI003C75B8D8